VTTKEIYLRPASRHAPSLSSLPTRTVICHGFDAQTGCDLYFRDLADLQSFVTEIQEWINQQDSVTPRGDIGAAAAICMIEANYWAAVEDDRLTQISLGAMGAAANICVALLRELTPEQFAKGVKRRDARPAQEQA